MSLINWKIELKPRSTNHCILSVFPAANADNDDGANSSNIIFTIKDPKLYVPLVTLSAKDNQKLSKLLRKGLKRLVYWNEYKTNNENKYTTNEYRYFLESNFVGVNRLFALIHLIQKIIQKGIVPKSIMKNYKVIVNGKNFYDQPIDSDIERYEEIGKLITGQDEDYTTGCLLDYEYIKNHYRLVAADLSRQKELDAHPKTIQHIKFAGQFKNTANGIVAGKFMF